MSRVVALEGGHSQAHLSKVPESPLEQRLLHQSSPHLRLQQLLGSSATLVGVGGVEDEQNQQIQDLMRATHTLEQVTLKQLIKKKKKFKWDSLEVVTSDLLSIISTPNF